MGFWSSESLAPDDALNEEIWTRSPLVQREIQSAVQAQAKGVGAQQAMLLPDRVLPWVPDILGTEWQHPAALLVVGSAYAPFVQGSAGRANAMRLDDYANAGSWQEFQQRFVAAVVRNDSSYYGPLAALAAATPSAQTCSHFALFDLCRASFVERSDSGGFRGGDQVVGTHCPLYERYVEHPVNRQWLWERLTRGQAGRIVVLGTIAEHGLLRLFERQGCAIVVGGAKHGLGQNDAGAWVKRYAAKGRTLSSWLSPSAAWWTITATVNGSPRRWTLLPVAHPSARGAREGYRREVEVLRAMKPT
jgi:hypothetical protein